MSQLQEGHVEVAECLVAHGADVNYNNGRPLEVAVEGGSAACVELLLRHGVAAGNDALWLAVKREAVAVVELLLERGVRSSWHTNHDGRLFTTLGLAVQLDSRECTELLLRKDNGIDVDEPAEGDPEPENGISPLAIAAVHDHVDVMKVLLAHGASVDKQSARSLSALFLAASLNRVRVLTLLLDNGADINLPGPAEMTPLAAAAQVGTA